MSLVPSSMHRAASAALALWATAVLCACGGGGGDAAGAASSGTGTSVSGTSAGTSAGAGGTSSAATATPATLSTCGQADFVATALARINARRAAGASCGTRGSFAPAVAVVWSDALGQAADGHSRDMAAQNYFSHTSLDGRTLAQRVDATGYRWRSLGENIAAGQRTVAEVVDAWMASDGHCANLMNPTFTQIGLACAPGGSTATYPTYWTLDLAAPA